MELHDEHENEVDSNAHDVERRVMGRFKTSNAGNTTGENVDEDKDVEHVWEKKKSTNNGIKRKTNARKKGRNKLNERQHQR